MSKVHIRMLSGVTMALLFSAGRSESQVVVPAKEYIRLGSKIIAIESPSPIEEQVSLSPSTTGVTFTVQDVDAASSSDVVSAGLLINNGFQGANACYLQLTFAAPNSNGPGSQVVLYGDDGSSMSAPGSLVPTANHPGYYGSPALSNNQCTLNTAAVTSSVGSELIWNVDIAFQGSFLNSGSKTIYVSAQKSNGLTEWNAVTTWNPSSTTTVKMPAAKVGIFRQGFFWVLDSNGSGAFEGTGSGQDKAFAFGGLSGDVPVTGDWNGDGHTKAGIYRPSTGTWLLDFNGNGVFDGTAGGDRVYQFGGVTGDVPVVGDWNGSGTSKVGVFRSGFLWVLDTNGNGVFDSGDSTYAFGGLAGDLPVVGDWSGNGTSKIGLWRTGPGQGYEWVLDYNGNGVMDNVNQAGGDKGFYYGGVTGDVPVVGDWNGDGTSKVGVFRYGYYWVLDYNGNHQFDGVPPDLAFAFGGISGDVPVVGRWAQVP